MASKRATYKPTKLEKRVESLLRALHLPYIPQYPVRSGFVIDFAVFRKGEKIAIEVDGERWHSSEKAKKRDRFKDYMLRREGWKVIRIKEQEVDEECWIGKLLP